MSHFWRKVYEGLEVRIDDETDFINRNPLRHHALVEESPERSYGRLIEDAEGYVDTSAYVLGNPITFGAVCVDSYLLTNCWCCMDASNQTYDLGLCLDCRDSLLEENVD